VVEDEAVEESALSVDGDTLQRDEMEKGRASEEAKHNNCTRGNPGLGLGASRDLGATQGSGLDASHSER
jgi:hypothetical protein